MTTQDDANDARFPRVARGESGDEQGQRQDIELSELDGLPDGPVPVDRFGPGASDQHESLAERLAEEVPDTGPDQDEPAERDADSQLIDEAPPAEAGLPWPQAGRLVAEDDESGNDPFDPYGNQDAYADMEPADGLSAEEAAMRVMEEEGETPE